MVRRPERSVGCKEEVGGCLGGLSCILVLGLFLGYAGWRVLQTVIVLGDSALHLIFAKASLVDVSPPPRDKIIHTCAYFLVFFATPMMTDVKQYPGYNDQMAAEREYAEDYIESQTRSAEKLFLGGATLPRDIIPKWLDWFSYLISPSASDLRLLLVYESLARGRNQTAVVSVFDRAI